MSNKLIIHNDSDLDDEDVLLYILKVVQDGKISINKGLEQYCFATTFQTGYCVTCTRRRDTYTFKIFKEI